MMAYKQMAPFAVQIELTEGCNLRCSFCGVNGIRGAERTYKFMIKQTAERVAYALADNKWNSRIEFAMHGEPTLNPNMVDIVKTFRYYLPKASLMMLSNGGGLVDDPVRKITQLFDAGLNTLGLDEYQNIKLVPKILERVLSDMAYDASFYVYPDEPEGNPHARQHHSNHRLVHIRPIDVSSSGTHATLNNHAGAGAPKNDSGQGKPCAKPFREMSVRWDGSVAICCNDWRGEYALGNLTKEPLEAVWNGEAAQAARRRLVIGQRDFGPCKGCDATSYRVGLLPDKLGRDKLHAPMRSDAAIIEATLKRKPLTRPVKREWE